MPDATQEEHVSIIRCPRCRGTERFRLLERATVSRAILGVDIDGNIEVDGNATIESDELGVEAQIRCQNRVDGRLCGDTWRLPSWAVSRLVYYS